VEERTNLELKFYHATILKVNKNKEKKAHKILLGQFALSHGLFIWTVAGVYYI
jgi:hypothetical protein